MESASAKMLEQEFLLADEIPNLMFSKPVSLTMFGTREVIKQWKQLYLAFCRKVYQYKTSRFLKLLGEPFAQNTKRICIKSTKKGMQRPYRIDANVWIEVNFNAAGLVRLCQEIGNACGINADQIIIQYRGCTDTTRRKGNDLIADTKSVPSVNVAGPNNYTHTTSEIISEKGLNNSPNSDTDSHWLKRIDTAIIPVMEMQADSYLSTYGFFALSVLWKKFRHQLSFITNPSVDFPKFFAQYILLKTPAHLLSGKFGIICALSSWDKEAALRKILGLLDAILHQATNGVTIHQILQKYPCMNHSMVNQIISAFIPRSIHITIGDADAWKLLEYFNFPEGFARTITEIVDNAQKDGASNILQTILNELVSVYGSLFCTKAELYDYDVLKQVISCHYLGIECRVWEDDRYVVKRLPCEQEGNVVTEDRSEKKVLPSVSLMQEESTVASDFAQQSTAASEITNTEEDAPAEGSSFDRLTQEMVNEILSKHFSNGFLFNSAIEKTRFDHFLSEVSGSDTIQYSDDELESILKQCCIIIGSRAYQVSREVEKRITEELETAISKGFEIFYYESFFEQFSDYLMKEGVVNVEIFKRILYKKFLDFPFQHMKSYFCKRCCAETERQRIDHEIARVWGSDTVLGYDDLSKRLPFIPLKKIKYALTNSSNYITNRRGYYANNNNVELSGSDIALIQKAADEIYAQKGYVSLCDLPLESIQEKNSALSITAIQNAAFNHCLYQNFDRKGKIITRQGESLDVLSIIKRYCENVDSCTLDDLFSLEKELFGELQRWCAMEAGYSILVRIEKDLFIADKYVDFDVEAIDSAIDTFIYGAYLPLKSFTTFATFPDCGQKWNLFVLESFCRRFSQRFRFDAPANNSRSAGAVIRKSCGLPYNEIMAEAVAESNIRIDNEHVGNWLREQGYLCVRNSSTISEITQKAKTLKIRNN